MRYHLVLEARPRDFMPIDINLLTKDHVHLFSSIEEIDNFTKKYSKEELMIMISDSNTVPSSYLGGNLEIINDHKYRYPVLYKTTNFSLDEFLINNINDKKVMNKFLNIYLKMDNSHKEQMQEAIGSKDIQKILYLLFSLSYLDVRNIYTYLNDNI